MFDLTPDLYPVTILSFITIFTALGMVISQLKKLDLSVGNRFIKEYG